MLTIALKLFFVLGNLAKSIIRWQFIGGNTEAKWQLLLQAWFKNRYSFAAKVGMLGLPVLYIFTPYLDFANYQLPLWLNILGSFLYILGLFIFYRAHRDLGDNWTPKVTTGHSRELITNGIYEQIRHPMYSAIWILSLSHSLLLTNWIAGFAGLLGFGYFYFSRIQKEEDILVSQFGKSYWFYMQKTGRLFPKVLKR